METLISEAGLWDWSAIIAGSIGGLASGAAAGLAAWFVFWLGLREERRKGILHEEKLRSELAFRGFIKTRDWLQYGLDFYLALHKSLDDGNNLAFEMPKSLKMGPFAAGSPEPERLAIEEFSFLATENKAALINDLYEIERWGFHLAGLSLEYSKLRLDWETWALQNSSIDAPPDESNKVASQFSGMRAIEAKLRTQKMDAILEAILEAGDEGVDRFPQTINEFLVASRHRFPSSFPNVSFELKT